MTGRAAHTRCGTCRAPILRQLVGDRVALTVTADLRPLTPAEEKELPGPNRLLWCLPARLHGTPRLRWIDRWHPPDCPHTHVIEHRCPVPEALF